MLANPYRGYRFPVEIISQCVWLYFNLSVSLREVELMMAYRGIQLSYETIGSWELAKNRSSYCRPGHCHVVRAK